MGVGAGAGGGGSGSGNPNLHAGGREPSIPETQAVSIMGASCTPGVITLP